MDACLGLVILDEETKTIRFVHYTIEEYFRNRADKHFPNGYLDVAEIWLVYLNFSEVAPHCANAYELEQKTEAFAFLKYAALYWGRHVAQQGNELVEGLALKLLRQADKTPCPLPVLYCHLPQVPWTYLFSTLLVYRDIVIKFSGVHVAAHFGLLQCLESLCRTIPADIGDDTCGTSLTWAAMNGHERVVQHLLERKDVDVNSKSDGGKTPLLWTAENGHEGVVKLLLGSGGKGKQL